MASILEYVEVANGDFDMLNGRLFAGEVLSIEISI